MQVFLGENCYGDMLTITLIRLFRAANGELRYIMRLIWSGLGRHSRASSASRGGAESRNRLWIGGAAEQRTLEITTDISMMIVRVTAGWISLEIEAGAAHHAVKTAQVNAEEGSPAGGHDQGENGGITIIAKDKPGISSATVGGPWERQRHQDISNNTRVTADRIPPAKSKRGFSTPSRHPNSINARGRNERRLKGTMNSGGQLGTRWEREGSKDTFARNTRVSPATTESEDYRKYLRQHRDLEQQI